jgi:hypothetical protein
VNEGKNDGRYLNQKIKVEGRGDMKGGIKEGRAV